MIYKLKLELLFMIALKKKHQIPMDKSEDMFSELKGGNIAFVVVQSLSCV